MGLHGLLVELKIPPPSRSPHPNLTLPAKPNVGGAPGGSPLHKIVSTEDSRPDGAGVEPALMNSVHSPNESVPGLTMPRRQSHVEQRAHISVPHRLRSDTSGAAPRPDSKSRRVVSPDASLPRSYIWLRRVGIVIGILALVAVLVALNLERSRLDPPVTEPDTTRSDTTAVSPGAATRLLEDGPREEVGFGAVESSRQTASASSETRSPSMDRGIDAENSVADDMNADASVREQEESLVANLLNDPERAAVAAQDAARSAIEAAAAPVGVQMPPQTYVYAAKRLSIMHDAGVVGVSEGTRLTVLEQRGESLLVSYRGYTGEVDALDTRNEP